MKKKIILSIISYIVILALLYFWFAFVKEELDPLKWETSGRLNFIAIGHLISIATISAIFIFSDETN